MSTPDVSQEEQGLCPVCVSLPCMLGLSSEWPWVASQEPGLTGGSAGCQKAPQPLSSVRGLGVAVAELAEPGEWRTALSWAQVAASRTHTWPRGFSAGLRPRAGIRRLSRAGVLVGVLPAPGAGKGGSLGGDGRPPDVPTAGPPSGHRFLVAHTRVRLSEATAVLQCGVWTHPWL